jgi:arylsulfatase
VLVCATTVYAQVLPQPEPPFKGKIGRTVKDSTPDFPKEVEAPKGAPNILLILTDDVGFGATNTFGGPIQTPTFQRLADDGLRYNTFHTTALCSPTRAALITGRNHHSCASGVITEFATGYPGYNSLVPRSCGSVGEVLRENGYNTAWFGKMHNVPDWMSSQAGPFDLWPSGLGFEYFTAFLAATAISGIPRYTRIRDQSNLTSGSLSIFSMTISPTRQSRGCRCNTLWHLTSRGF